jgi:hypothetical protein
MALIAFTAQTLRAIVSGIFHPLELSECPDRQEAATAYALMEWRSMREPYRTACVLAMITLHLHSLLKYRSSLRTLSAAQVAALLEDWLRLPVTQPGDFVRAMTLFSLMSALDQSTTWDDLSLAEAPAYTRALRLYHDLPNV